MTITETIIIFASVMGAGALVGILLRCYQENYLYESWKYIFVFFFILIFGILTVPLVIPFTILKNKDIKVFQRIILSLFSVIAIPFGIIHSIWRINKLLELTVWGNASKLNDIIKIKKLKKIYSPRVQSPIPNLNSTYDYINSTILTVKKYSSMTGDRIINLFAQ